MRKVQKCAKSQNIMKKTLHTHTHTHTNTHTHERDNKKRPRVEQVEPWSCKYCSRQRYPVHVCWLIFLNLTLGSTAFGNSAFPENWTLLYESLSMLATNKSGCSHGNYYSLSTINKKFLSTFNFVPEINEFL